MGKRDVERVRSRAKFVATLRRVADAVEAGEPFRIQVAECRFVVPAGATLSVEHEAEGGREELELQLAWKSAPPRTTGARPSQSQSRVPRRRVTRK